MVKDSLRDAAQEKAAECPESSGSKNDQIHIAAACAFHDLLCGITLGDQSHGRMLSVRDHGGTLREHRLRIRQPLPSLRIRRLAPQ